ncbi:MAG: DHHA1 domain-containing protein [Thermoplasmatota archaeon]
MEVHPGLQRRARDAADWLQRQEEVTVVCHIDADGVSAGAIAAEALERAGIGHRVEPVKSLDDPTMERLLDAGHDALWFGDLGSAVHDRFGDVPKLVCDHHQLLAEGAEAFPHVNPLLEGLDGHTEASGAGTAYLVAHALDPANIDLLPMALVGGAADLQDRPNKAFVGSNGALVAAGVAAGILTAGPDLGFYGPHVRPLPKWLGLARDSPVPGVTGHPRDADRFLSGLGIDPVAAGGTWGELPETERVKVRSAIVDRILDCDLGPDAAEDLFRQVVEIQAEAAGQPVKELQSFATLLNATARYDEADVGLAVARGDRDDAYQKALGLLTGHRQHLAGALRAFEGVGVTQHVAIQTVHLEDKVRDTVVGIVCGMALDSLDLRQDLALLGFAHTPDGRTKVSSRCPRALAGRIDLAAALRDVASRLGGQGGGHAGAAGATIDRGLEEDFAAGVDAIVAQQLGRRPATPARAAPPSGWRASGAGQTRLV